MDQNGLKMLAGGQTPEAQIEIRRVTAPLTMEQIKEFFEKKNIRFLIDYGSSQVKDQSLLVYISNLDLPCDIDFSAASQDEILAVIKAFMETKSLLGCDTLRGLVAQLVLESRGVDADFIFDVSPLHAESRKRFIEANADLFKRWNHFIGSSFIHFLTSFQALEDAYHFKSAVPQIHDPNYIGYNVVHLFSFPGFVEAFFSAPVQEQPCYFKHQFEEYIFKGQNFFAYFNHENNLLAVGLSGLLLGNGAIEAKAD